MSLFYLLIDWALLVIFLYFSLGTLSHVGLLCQFLVMKTLRPAGKLFEQEGKQLKATKEVPETDQLF